MLITIPDVLNKEELAVVRDYISQASFVDGKLSAGHEASDVKNNLEMQTSDQHMAQLNNLVMGKLVKHPVYWACRPALSYRPFNYRVSELARRL
jgi:PKHD-type hydroxylase